MRISGIAALPALLPGSAAACAVCFGRAPGAQGLFDGIWWGIILLLSATMGALGGIAWLLCKVEKSRRAAEADG
ncbi:MAG: hypothetical protein HYZ74_06005 [Elusimicrobia bacterium]|nr:hypothetical protein [Elusimicrobiota bacterium]